MCSLHHPGTSPDDEVVDGVRVLRADAACRGCPTTASWPAWPRRTTSWCSWSARLGDWRPDVVHAHDWLVAWAGDTLKTLFGVPLVATIHATERGRHGGHLPPGLPGEINSVEWWLTYQAREVIACSRFMVREVVAGLRAAAREGAPGAQRRRRRRCGPRAGGTAAPAREPLVVAWGRIQYEKGFQVLARAIGELRHRVPGIRCVIAGRGTYLPELQTQIDMEGVSDLVHLAGFVPDDELRALLAARPAAWSSRRCTSRSASSRSRAWPPARPPSWPAPGGLAEIVEGTDAGVLFEPGNHHELADRIAEVAGRPGGRRRLRDNAAALLRRTYTWDAIATATVDVYGHALR